jgi:hypothetical protein
VKFFQLVTAGTALVALGILIGYTIRPGVSDSGQRQQASPFVAPVDVSSFAAASSGAAEQNRPAPDAWRSLLSVAVSIPPGMARELAGARLIDSITRENWRAAHEAIRAAVAKGLLNEQVLHWCLQRVGAVGGREAMDVLGADWIAIRGWAAEDPAAAENYIEALPADAAQRNLRMGFIIATAGMHPEAALRVLNRMPAHNQSRAMDYLTQEPSLTAFVRDWLDANSASESFPATGEGSIGFTFMQMARSGLGFRTPTAMMEWFDQFAGRPYAQPDLLFWLPESLNHPNAGPPAKVLDWLSQVSSQNPESARQTFEKLYAEAPTPRIPESVQWLEQHRHLPVYDYAVLGLMRNPAIKELMRPAEQQAWIATITDRSTREKAEGSLAR